MGRCVVNFYIHRPVKAPFSAHRPGPPGRPEASIAEFKALLLGYLLPFTSNLSQMN